MVHFILLNTIHQTIFDTLVQTLVVLFACLQPIYTQLGDYDEFEHYDADYGMDFVCNTNCVDDDHVHDDYGHNIFVLLTVLIKNLIV